VIPRDAWLNNNEIVALDTTDRRLSDKAEFLTDIRPLDDPQHETTTLLRGSAPAFTCTRRPRLARTVAVYSHSALASIDQTVDDGSEQNHEDGGEEAQDKWEQHLHRCLVCSLFGPLSPRHAYL